MKFFVYEYCCAEQPSSSLRLEGEAMLVSILADIGSVPGWTATTLRFEDGAPLEATFRTRSAEADCTIVIAPEFDSLLETRSRWVEEVEGTRFGPELVTIRLASDKWRCAAHLSSHGVATIPTRKLMSPWDDFPCVVKPRFGAGSVAMSLATSEGELAAAREAASREGFDELVVQPLHVGQPTSVVCFVGPTQSIALPATEQHLSDDSRFEYLGGRLPISHELDERATQLALEAVRTLPGARGYLGVDLILGDDPTSDVVVEINPRWTTSYLGLRRQTDSNLVVLLVDVFEGRAVQPPLWRPGILTFDKTGTFSRID